MKLGLTSNGALAELKKGTKFSLVLTRYLLGNSLIWGITGLLAWVIFLAADMHFDRDTFIVLWVVSVWMAAGSMILIKRRADDALVVEHDRYNLISEKLGIGASIHIDPPSEGHYYVVSVLTGRARNITSHTESFHNDLNALDRLYELSAIADKEDLSCEITLNIRHQNKNK